MDDFELPLPGEYDDISRYEDEYADDFDALNDFEEDFPVVKSRASKLRETKSQESGIKQDNDEPNAAGPETEEPFQVLQSARQFAVPELDDEAFLESLMPQEPKPKRQKIEDEDFSDTELEDIEPLPEATVPVLQKYKKPVKRHVYTRPPFGKDHITVTDTEGRRVFVPVAKKDEEFSNSAGKLKISKSNLLAVPFDEIRQIVDEKRHANIMDRADEIRALIKGVDDDTEDITEMSEDQSENDQPEVALWVEKFTPKRFTELLSDDGINRILLKWLKLWDEYVFGKSKKKMHKIKKENPNQQEQQNKFGKRKQIWDYEEELDVDHTGRPKFKIALLAGNPGLGKTTLAHVVANHAGYNPVEMNASDDRSAELFKNKLEATTQMKACMGDGNRPNCLIIDEIDGAPVQAINILLQAVKETEESTSKKKKKSLTVTRPIICICNDLYVPALRQLRQIALTLSVPQITPARLAQRLVEISRKQKMRADMACLLALCDKSENDIRSCINTLQFVFKKHGELKLQNLQDISIGQKDIHKDLFYVLRSIFRLPKPGRKGFGFLQQMSKNSTGPTNLALSRLQSEIGSSKVQTSNSMRFHNILDLASSNGEYDKLIQGLFDNYLNVKSKDPHLDTVVNCTSWFQFADRIETKIRAEQKFTLMKFYPFLPVNFHMNLAAALVPKLSYSNSAIEFNTKVSRSKQILDAVVNDVRPHVKRNVGNVSAILDLYPYLYEVIQPSLRPVNVQLYSQSEKQHLLMLISTMISYSLSYNQERSFDGQYTYILQPNIEEIIAFPNLPQHKHLTYAAKQLIQREIDLEKMRRIERSLGQLDIANDKSKSKQHSGKGGETFNIERIQPLKVKPLKTKPVLDFFGRVIEPQKETERSSNRIPSIINTDIWFKFNEGYTNAVRRTVKVQDFL
eukprot:Seg2672.7 transcript_id=Seg2672.7/GoldUCD/mRNA.D3Y31 product="Chromosome transmission fidelity protein 18-like" protein_id=Seg2672.7/GoldUCD/D3Y31